MHIDLVSPADFAGVDDIVTNLAKEREPGEIEFKTVLDELLCFILFFYNHCHLLTMNSFLQNQRLL